MALKLYLINRFVMGVCLIISPLLIQAQIGFEKTYGGPGTESARRVQITPEGGYIMVGHTTSHDSADANIYVIKTDMFGDTLWTKSIGGSGLDYGYSIYKTNDGNFIIAASTKSTGAGGDDFYLIKIGGNGAVLWAKTYGGTGEDIAREAIQTTDGGYIIVGYTNSPGASFFDAYLIKTNANGDTTWTKTYGGMSYDAGTSVKQTSDGGYILLGETFSFGAGSSDYYLIKTDATGNITWTKTYGGAAVDEGSYVQLTSDGGYIVIGDSESYGAGDADIYVVKTNATGDSLWSKTYGGPLKDVGKTIEPTSSGGYIIAGVNRSVGIGFLPDVWILNINSIGDTIWTKTYGGANHEHGYDAKQTADGGYIVVSHGNIVPGNKEDVYLLKLDSLGNMDSTTNINPIFVASELLINSFAVYPNPSNGIFKVELNSNNSSYPAEIKLLNAAGQIIYEENIPPIISTYSTTINISEYAKGIYFLGVTSNNYSITRKVLLY